MEPNTSLAKPNHLLTKDELLRSAGTKLRYLKKEQLALKFGEDELNQLLFEPHNVYHSTADALFSENYKKRRELQDSAKKWCKTEKDGTKTRKTVFTVAEDDFIKKSYKHLSDNTIALALEVPSKAIRSRRTTLKLRKLRINTNKYGSVIVWNNRGTFEQDCLKYGLTKSNELRDED